MTTLPAQRKQTPIHRDVWACLLALTLLLILAGCKPTAPASPAQTVEAPLASPTQPAQPTQAPTSTATTAPLPSPTLEPTSTPAPTATPGEVFYEPAGCWQPPDDDAQVSVNGVTLNARTYAMLQQAAMLYGGEIDVAGTAILQGSYNADPAGIHSGGGAVDLSLKRPNTDIILYNDIEPLIRALRTVGFAAWLRSDDEMGSGPDTGTVQHIHAVALGDKDLSPAAQEEISGSAGYLRGYDGVPVTEGDPTPDEFGGPVICHWMLETGYTDLRDLAVSPAPIPSWQERLRQASLAYLAPYPEDAEKVARLLNFMEGENESAENMCGPLAGAILRDAGLLPAGDGPALDLKNYFLARPNTNGRPWSLFPESDYEVFRYDTPLAEFDFKAWPFQPADFVYTYAKDGGFEHMFIVTEVDAKGRAYTVTNQPQAWGNAIWGSMLIQRYLLYDPQEPGAGIIYNQWSDPKLGRTGFGGFEVLRKRGLEPGSSYTYTIRPGDTLPYLAVLFGATLESIDQANSGVDLANLQIGQSITIPILTGTSGTP